MKQEPAHSVIQALGGPSAVAKIVGLTPQAVMAWRSPKEKRGTGGLIPQGYWPHLIAAAKAQNVPLAYEDFLQIEAAE